MKNFLFQKKNTSVGSKHQSNPTLVFLFEMKNFSFQKNLQVLNFPLVIFFLEKVWDIAKFRKYQGKND